MTSDLGSVRVEGFTTLMVPNSVCSCTTEFITGFDGLWLYTGGVLLGSHKPQTRCCVRSLDSRVCYSFRLHNVES